MLQDERHAKKFAAAMDKEARPGLVDYDRVAREVHRLTQHVVWLHRTMSNGQGDKIPMPTDPVYPTEAFRDDIESDDDAKFWSQLVRSNPQILGGPKLN